MFNSQSKLFLLLVLSFLNTKITTMSVFPEYLSVSWQHDEEAMLPEWWEVAGKMHFTLACWLIDICFKRPIHIRPYLVEQQVCPFQTTLKPFNGINLGLSPTFSLNTSGRRWFFTCVQIVQVVKTRRRVEVSNLLYKLAMLFTKPSLK